MPVQAICWTTWAIIGLLVAVGLMVFNAFPDYNSQHSWCAGFGSSVHSHVYAQSCYTHHARMLHSLSQHHILTASGHAESCKIHCNNVLLK